MKDARAALRTILLADAAINAAVTEGSVKHIYPQQLPQGLRAAGAIAISNVSGVLGYHMQGADAIIEERMQVACWALDQDAAFDLAALVFDRLSGYSSASVVYDTTVSPALAMRVHGIFWATSADQYDDSAKLFGRRLDFLMWHEV